VPGSDVTRRKVSSARKKFQKSCHKRSWWFVISMMDLVIESEARASFEVSFREHYARIHRLITRVTGDSAASEDIASEVFVKLLRKPPLDTSSVEGWLSRGAVWAALDYVRRRSRESRSIFAARCSIVPDPSDLHETQRRVRKILGRIKPEDAEMLVLREEGYTYVEIAGLLHRNASSLGTLMLRAESAFRKEWVKLYGYPER